MREKDKVTKQTLAPLFENDLNALKREAACDTLKSNKRMSEMQFEFMSSHLAELQNSLTANDDCQLTPVYMDFHGIHSAISGCLNSYKQLEPPEINRKTLLPGEIEPD